MQSPVFIVDCTAHISHPVIILNDISPDVSTKVVSLIGDVAISSRNDESAGKELENRAISEQYNI